MIPRIPKLFSERLSSMVDDRKGFFASLNSPPPYAFRINTLKGNRKTVLERFERYGIGYEQIPFFRDGFVTRSLDVGNTIEHFLGMVYIQEVVSMIPPLVIDIGREVLDACAAPGSKTTQLAALMENRGMLVANDNNYGRIKALTGNLERAGATNTMVTNRSILDYGGSFDSVMLDAPCSSEGTVRKNPELLSRWSMKSVISHSNLQKRMIIKCFDLLKSGGSMVYSTCTFSPEENEEVIDYLLEKREGSGLESLSLRGFRTSPGIERWKGKDFECHGRVARIWPHHNDTGGFFVAKVRKA